MAISVSLAVTTHGGAVTAAYRVTGNLAPGILTEVEGNVQFGAVPYSFSGTLTRKGQLPPVSYGVPVCPGLKFTVTAVPSVFTAEGALKGKVTGSVSIGGVAYPVTGVTSPA